MDARRVGPVVVVAAVLGFLGWQTLRHRDANPLEDPAAAAGKGPGVAVDRYATSGRNKRLTGEADPAVEGGPALPRTPLPEGHPSIGAHGVPVQPSPAGASPAVADGADARLPFTFTAPAGWTRVPPANEMRIAQWSLPAQPAGEPGELYLSTARGGVEANIARWAGQFGKDTAETKRLTVNELAITRVSLSGSFTGMSGPMAPAPGKKDDWRLLGAVVELPDTLYFVKATGPAAVMAREEAAFDAFLSSLAPR